MFTSLDFLYFIIAFCLLILTGFLIWIMYYIAMILRQGNEIVTEFRQKVEEIENSIHAIHEKVFNSANAVSFLVKEFGQISNLVREFKSSRAQKKASKKNSKKNVTNEQPEV